MNSPRRDVGSAPRPAPALAGFTSRPHRPAHPRDALLRLQRRCGNRRARGIIQAKLNVGPADDRFEREADRIARQAMAPTVRRAPEAIERVQGATGGAADPAVAQAVARARGGRPVPNRVRERMERVSGAVFGGVRVHVDAEADRLNDALGSRAFTVGADVFVRRSEYRPGSARGDALLGHELVHTLQQGAAQPRSSASSPAPATPTAQRRVDPTLRLSEQRRRFRELQRRLRGSSEMDAWDADESTDDSLATQFDEESRGRAPSGLDFDDLADLEADSEHSMREAFLRRGSASTASGTPDPELPTFTEVVRGVIRRAIRRVTAFWGRWWSGRR